MPRYVAHLSYLGTHYCGWQIQKKESGKIPSVQQVIEEKLSIVTKQLVKITGSGRTDAGVHASGQVFHFQLNKASILPLDKLAYSLNSLLPNSIRILRIQPCAAEFHAQRSAIKKQYSYYFQLGPQQLPQFKEWMLWWRHPIDVDLLTRAITPLRGIHDFKVFCASGSGAKTTTREIYDVALESFPILFPGTYSEKFEILRFRIVGSGFLKQMVRSLVGTLLLVAQDKAPQDVFERLLKDGQRQDVGPTARPNGLWLERVWYSDFGPQFHSDPTLTSPIILL